MRYDSSVPGVADEEGPAGALLRNAAAEGQASRAQFSFRAPGGRGIIVNALKSPITVSLPDLMIQSCHHRMR